MFFEFVRPDLARVRVQHIPIQPATQSRSQHMVLSMIRLLDWIPIHSRSPWLRNLTVRKLLFGFLVLFSGLYYRSLSSGLQGKRPFHRQETTLLYAIINVFSIHHINQTPYRFFPLCLNLRCKKINCCCTVNLPLVIPLVSISS